jgi:PhzF family phenazine biosynthesis protein
VNVQRISAFSHEGKGGNPAGVVLCAELPPPEQMQAVAAEIGYSETVFAAPAEGGWRTRYFAPKMEVPFCGHATIALGASLALAHGDGIYPLILNTIRITVEGRREGAALFAALQSPATHSEAAERGLVDAALALFGDTQANLDPRLPAGIAEAGARHLVLPLASRARLAAMSYDFAAGQQLMTQAGLTTISLVYAENRTRFHARNPFPTGGIYEDPATGAAAAALGGYLRDLGWPHDGAIDILQGEDMGLPSRLHADIGEQRGGSIRVSGAARLM